MRKLVPFLLCLCFTAKAQNFTPGNIVVVRIGDGIATISTGIAAPVFLDEYYPSGTLRRSIALPTALAGSNKMLTCNGASTAEGSLNISADGQFLTLCGYNASVGTAGGLAVGSSVAGTGIDNSVPSIINRVIALVNYSGIVDTRTALTDAFDKVNFRSVVTDNGTNFWMCGSTYTPSLATSGIRYASLANTTSTKISNNIDNAKTVGIFNNQLFVTSGTASNRTIGTLGSGMQTTGGQIFTNINGLPDGSQLSPNGFIFFDMDTAIPGPDLLYICDDGASTSSTQGLNKYSFDGSTWTKQGRLTDDCTGVTGYIGCDGKVVLFVTSNANANNKIYKFIDNANYNAVITNNASAISSVATIFATAGLKQVFRGIQMAPSQGLTITGTTTLPIGNYNKITIKSGANVTPLGNVAIADKLIVESGATLDCSNFVISSIANTAGYFELQNGATLKIGSANGITATASNGNIQTCIRRFNSGGIYEYNGTEAQNTGDGLPAIITGKLTLNNTANITLSSNTKVNGTINFNAGRLKTSATSYITATSSTLYNKYPATYAQTAEETSFIDGLINFESSATTYQLLPIGKGSHFAPIGITPFNNTLKTYAAEYFATTPTDYLNISGGLDHISKLEYWEMNCSITAHPDMDAKMTLYWSPNSVVGHAGDDANALPDLRITHYADNGSGIKWQIDNAGASGFTRVGGIDYGKISANDYTTHFSPFTLASSTYRNLLPLQLLKFTALQTNNKVQLQWQTTNEVDMDYFIIERSQDGQNFTSVKNSFAINKFGVNEYSIIDEKTIKGLNFYRLVMVGKNGRKDYSAIEKIWIGNEAKMSLYPNPTKDFVYIKLPAADGFLSIADPTGKRLKEIQVQSNLMQLNVSDLAAGTYYILYDNLREKANLKFVKLH